MHSNKNLPHRKVIILLFNGIRFMGLWFVYVYNLEVTYIKVWYNLNGSYIKSGEKAWLNRW